jgi:hypothetical protein
VTNDYNATTKVWDDGEGSCFDQYNLPVAKKCSGGDLAVNDAMTLTWYDGMNLYVPAMAMCKSKEGVWSTGRHAALRLAHSHAFPFPISSNTAPFPKQLGAGAPGPSKIDVCGGWSIGRATFY